MKEIYMLAGVGVGMIAGIMLYKYCDGAKKIVDQTEKTLMKKAKKMEKQAERGMEKVEEKVNEVAKKITKKLK